jgi:tellurite resistance protein
MPDVEGARRVYELMVLTAWADGKVEPNEALTVREIVAGFPDIGNKSELSRAVKKRIDEKGFEDALRETAAAVTDRAERELAFRCCARVLNAGEMDAADLEALASLQELFSLSGEDVKRLMANLDG